MNETRSHCIDECNKLLRDERSAVHVYDHAIDTYIDSPESLTLQIIRDDHADAVTRLERNIRSMDGRPDAEPGVWGALAATFQSSAAPVEEHPSIETLLDRERTCRADYESALDDSSVMAFCKSMIREDLLPRIDAHLSALEEEHLSAPSERTD